MLIANPIGALMLLLTMAIMAIGLFVFKFRINGPTLISFGCLMLLLIDLSYRLFRKRNDKWFYENASGGNLFFLPAWSFGLIILVINIVRLKIK